MIVGAITFISSMGAGGGGVAHTAHLGGLIVGYHLSQEPARRHPLQELKYRWLRWKMARARSKFDVYSGGRNRRRRRRQLEERLEEAHSLRCLRRQAA